MHPQTHTPPPSSSHQPRLFELDAGVLCLDFVNTRGSLSGEHLHSYADLVDFAHQSALLTPSEARRLQAQAQRRPAAAGEVLERARRLRQALFAMFSTLAAGQTPATADLAILNAELATGMSHACVQGTASGYRWGWRGDGFDRVLWPVVRSAADLLTSDAQRPLVRECGAGDCRWLFLDTSKNRSRQWCSMRSCGNREKARRHYQRLKAKRSA
jgi:predicted RNA-binding Zn ribbon-like protein